MNHAQRKGDLTLSKLSVDYLKLCDKPIYAPASKDWGHIVLPVSVCLSVCLSKTECRNISLSLQNYPSHKTHVWYTSTCHQWVSNEGHLSKVKVKFLTLSLNTQINRAFSKIVLLRGHGVLQTHLIFSSTGPRPASYCHGIMSVVRP